MNEAQIIAFLEKAKTRGGVPFKATGIETDSQGNNDTICGYVVDAVNDVEQQIPMIWNLHGRAMISTIPLKYDLVIEIPIEYTPLG